MTAAPDPEELLVGAHLSPRRHGPAAADQWASVIADLLASPSEPAAFRALLALSDDLAAASPEEVLALTRVEPPSCGVTRFDAGLAAVVEYHCLARSLPPPPWVNAPDRFLTSPWMASPHTDLTDVPVSFRVRGIILAESELASI